MSWGPTSTPRGPRSQHAQGAKWPSSRLRTRESRRPPPGVELPRAGGAMLRAAPLASGLAEWETPTFADSEPRRWPFG
eukprot:1112523-Alexandrium_andersonii.AAC.1